MLKLQKQAARVISDADNQASSVKLFSKLQWLPFYEESKIAKCCVAYKRIKGEVPLYTENSLILNSQQHNRATRYSNTNFICPRFKLKLQKGVAGCHGNHFELILKIALLFMTAIAHNTSFFIHHI